MNALVNLVGLFAIALSTLALGHAVLSRLRLICGQVELNLALAGGLGLGILSYTTFLLAALHLLHLPAWLLLIAFLITAALLLPRNRMAVWSNVRWRVSLSGQRMFYWGLLGILAVHLLLNLLAALAPATGVDSLLYHLAVPAIYLQKGGMVQLPSIYPSNWPFTVQMTFLYALWLRGDAVAQLLNFWSVVLTILGLYGLTRRWCSARAALLAVALYVSISDVTYQSSVALTDVMAALFLLLSVAALVIWLEQRQDRWLVFAGVLAGWFAGSRISNAGLVIGLGLALGLLVIQRVRSHQWHAAVRAVFLFGVCAFLVTLPWYLRSWAYTGNPVYPYLYSLFGGRYFSAEAAAYNTELNLYKTLGPRSPAGFLKMPWVLTVDPKQYRSGTLGPVVLACLPLLLLYRRKLPPWTGLALLFVLVSTPIWYLTYTRLRSLLPVVMVLIILLAMAIDSLQADHNSCRMLRLSVTLSIALWLVVGLGNNWRTHGDAVLAVVGVKDRESYVDAELRSTGFDWYRDYQYLNRVLPEDANVLIWDERGYYLKRDYIWAGGLTRGMTTPEQLTDPAELLVLLRSLHITHTAWHPSRVQNEGFAKLRETLLATGCTFPAYQTETIVVRRIDYGRTCTP